MLRRWLYVEDLGGWVHASDTGEALGRNSLDVFIGETRMAPYARRLGVHFWNVGLCLPSLPSPALAQEERATQPLPSGSSLGLLRWLRTAELARLALRNV